MSINSQLQELNYRVGVLYDKYAEMKKRMCLVYALDSQDELTLDVLERINADYDNWEMFWFLEKNAFKQTYSDVVAKLHAKLTKLQKAGVSGKEQKKATEAIEIIKNQLSFAEANKQAIEDYIGELGVMWCNMVDKFRINSIVEPADYTKDELENGFIYVHSASIEQLYDRILDKLPEGEDIEFKSPKEEHLFERALAVTRPWSLTILRTGDVKRIKKIAERYGVECNLVKWTPESCTQYTFDEKGAYTPFKEMDDTIKTM